MQRIRYIVMFRVAIITQLLGPFETRRARFPGCWERLNFTCRIFQHRWRAHPPIKMSICERNFAFLQPLFARNSTSMQFFFPPFLFEEFERTNLLHYVLTYGLPTVKPLLSHWGTTASRKPNFFFFSLDNYSNDTLVGHFFFSPSFPFAAGQWNEVVHSQKRIPSAGFFKATSSFFMFYFLVVFFLAN